MQVSQHYAHTFEKLLSVSIRAHLFGLMIESRYCPTVPKGQKMIEETATRIALCEIELGIDVSVEDSLKELKFGLVEVVYEWARGMVSMHCFFSRRESETQKEKHAYVYIQSMGGLHCHNWITLFFPYLGVFGDYKANRCQ